MDVIPPNGRWYLVPRMGASIRIGIIALGRLSPGWVNVPPFMWETFQSLQVTVELAVWGDVVYYSERF